MGFINYELQLTNQGWQPLSEYCRIFDTLPLARQLHVGQRNSLDALCKRYNVDNSNREFHGALLDAHLLVQVYLAMTGGQGSLFDDEGVSFEPEQQLKRQRQKKLKVGRHSLPVIMLTAEEEKEHQMKLKQMAEKGACLWLELEKTEQE